MLELSFWINPDRDLTPLWEALKKDKLPLISTSNPLYDLVSSCQDLSEKFEAVRLAFWSDGCLTESWSRDEASLLDESRLPRCKDGLILHLFEKGPLSILQRFKMAPSDPGCPIWYWKDQNQDPALATQPGIGLTDRILWFLFDRPSKETSFYQGFPQP